MPNVDLDGQTGDEASARRDRDERTTAPNGSLLTGHSRPVSVDRLGAGDSGRIPPGTDTESPRGPPQAPLLCSSASSVAPAEVVNPTLELHMTSRTPSENPGLRPSASPPSPPVRPKKVTVPAVRRARERGVPLVMATAYDAQQARVVDAAGVDVVLVGDSVAMVVLGHADTLSVTVDEMLHHVRAVRRGLERALLVADMPYGSFHVGPEDAVRNALRFVREGGAQAVKIEGPRPEIVETLVGAEIPVVAHLGLTPQSLHRFGGFKVQGRSEAAREAILAAAGALEDAGAFALVLECVPADLAAEITEAVGIPTIGIGAGPACDGQVLVYHDVLGLEERIAPRFVRRYAELGVASREAIAAWAADVREGRFPAEAESFGEVPPPAALERLYG